MNQTLRLLLVFVLIAGATFWYYHQSTPNSTVTTTDRDFAVPNIEEVYKIFIADRNGKTATLERKNDHWQYNKKWRANPNTMAHLLQTIQKVKLKYIPARAAIQNIVTDIATNNIKVEIYNKENEPIKVYYVGGVTNDELGTYMILEGAENPYVTYLPGFEGSLRIRYLLNELDWRDKTIFSTPMADIQSVSIEYPKQKNQSFKLAATATGYDVVPFYETTPRQPNPVKKGKAEQFLIGFEQLVAEAFENKHAGRDSIIQQLPFCILTLKTKQGEQKELRLHPIMKKDDQGQPMLRADGQLLIERYFANVNQADLVLIQERVFGKVLWAYDYFFE